MAIISPLKKIFNWQLASEKIKPGYKVYSAFLSQSGIDAPVATIMENTIGNIVWTYAGVGNYQGILAGAFPSGKSWAMAVGDSLTGMLEQIGFDNDSTVQIYNYDVGTGILSDWTGMYIEIRVYN